MSGFVGRDEELAQLREKLIEGTQRVAEISGGPGTGKTALAFVFFDMFGEKHFPVGRFHFHAYPFIDLVLEVLDSVPNSKRPALIIIDEAHNLSPSTVASQIQQILDSRPSAKIIVISQLPITIPQSEINIHLGNLTLQSMNILILRTYGVQLERYILENLYERVQGNPLAINTFMRILQAKALTLEELLESFEPILKQGLVDPYGIPLSSESASRKRIIADVVGVSHDLLQRLKKESRLLYDLTPRAFEEFVADLLNRLGYEVTLTPASRDGGKDIYAAKKEMIGSFLYVVECKKYAPDRPVGVGIIRQLYGVVQAERATAGILATTSFFTKGAQEFQHQLAFQLSLQDYFGIQKWLKSAMPDGT
ncbi:MAG: restriction endonuclease [Acidobacteriota bacterium]|nr:restriction endonuclease [Acidobacteriota bacterium]